MASNRAWREAETCEAVTATSQLGEASSRAETTYIGPHLIMHALERDAQCQAGDAVLEVLLRRESHNLANHKLDRLALGCSSVQEGLHAASALPHAAEHRARCGLEQVHQLQLVDSHEGVNVARQEAPVQDVVKLRLQHARLTVVLDGAVGCVHMRRADVRDGDGIGRFCGLHRRQRLTVDAVMHRTGPGTRFGGQCISLCLVRSILNRDLRRLVGSGAGAHARAATSARTSRGRRGTL